MGDLLYLQLEWQAAGPAAPAEVTAFVHLLDEAGNLAAQSDGNPGRGLIPFAQLAAMETAVAETRIITANPGNYQMLIGLYQPQTGERIPVFCRTPFVCMETAVEVPFTFE